MARHKKPMSPEGIEIASIIKQIRLATKVNQSSGYFGTQGRNDD